MNVTNLFWLAACLFWSVIGGLCVGIIISEIWESRKRSTSATGEGEGVS